MNPLEDEAPKLSKLPFIAGDLALLATAFVIATRSDSPLSPAALFAVTACVVIGAALAVVPFLADYARRQDAALKERQDQIAALARVTAESAEQLGIVASGLNGISESSKHNLEALAQLPAQLKTRVDDAVRQLSAAAQSAHASVKDDLARLEKLSGEIKTLATQAAETLQASSSAASAKADALASAETALSATLARATREIETFAAAAKAAALSAESSAKIAQAVKTSAKAAKAPAKEPAPPARESAEPPAAEPALEPVAPPAAPEPAEPPAPAPQPVSEEPAPAPEPVPEPAPAAAVPPELQPDPEPAPFQPAEPEAAEVPVDEPPAPKPPRARKPKSADDTPDLGLVADTAETESSITSDGFTRLIATAYIGIGNKLFIRGEGPGLSWDKGVPLQFVSIGKWRWESPDASAPVKAKLYKNDQVECVGLGQLTLEPGRQHEVNAGF